MFFGYVAAAAAALAAGLGWAWWRARVRACARGAARLRGLAAGGGTAVVTGATSGLGREFARQLVCAHGFRDVLLVARRGDALEEAAAELRGLQPAARVRVLAADLATDAGLSSACGAVSSLPAIALLVNNAGVGAAGLLHAQDAAVVERLVRLNVLAAAELLRAALARMAPAGRGLVVNVSSASAYQPLPSHALYGASKAFLSSLSLAAAYEMRRCAPGVLVHALEPGTVSDTGFQAAAGQTRKAGASSPDVVAACLASCARDELSLVPGTGPWLQAQLVSLLPRPLVLVLAWRVMSTRMPAAP